MKPALAAALVALFLEPLSPVRAAQAPLSSARLSAAEASVPTRVTVPAGWFLMGSQPAHLKRAFTELASLEVRPEIQKQLAVFMQDEIPERRIHLRAFRVDRQEVTRAAYDRCVRLGPCKALASPSRLGAFSRPDAPLVNVSWEEAQAYCRFVGGRLPTEAEWEKAARGPFGRPWPWGETWHERACNHGALHPVHPMFHGSDVDGYFWVAPVSSFPRDRSYYGVMDMAGNVAEWVADWYQPGWWAKGPVPTYNPTGSPGGAGRLIKGGSFLRLRILSRPSARRFLFSSEHRAPDVGFRCAYDLRR